MNYLNLEQKYQKTVKDCSVLRKENTELKNKNKENTELKNENKLDFEVNFGNKPLKNVNEAECKAWAGYDNKNWKGSGSWIGDPTGCITTNNGVWFNKAQTLNNCGHGNYKCVERK